MNNTERPSTDQIISSGITAGTERNDVPIILSSIDSPQIISSSLSNEIILNGIKYKILKQIARSGESEIYLVGQNGGNFVFKYYYSQYKPKDEILKKLKGLKHPDIICLIDHGYYQERFFEISEYAQGGTLQEIMPVNTIGKIKEIVGQTIEALNYCHSHGIIHRDIKPENIFYSAIDKKDIVIGDFGIASNVKEGDEDVLTTLARTNLYAAPELFSSIRGKTIIEKSVDYYALGITLLHLWFGRNPFEDIDEYSVMRLKSEGRIVFPDHIDHEVEKLIKGLITVNPRDRWAYDETKRWLKGEDVKVNYQTVQFAYKPYSFGMIGTQQIIVNNPKDLAYYLEKYPEKGEGHLYRNTIAKWIEPIDPGLFNELMDIVEKDYPRDKTAGLTKAIYILDTEKPFKVLNGIELNKQEDIALHLEQHFGHYEKDLKNPNASFYLFLEAKNYKDKAIEYRGYFTKTNAEAALNTLIFTLQGSGKFIIDHYTIYQPEELLRVDDVRKAKIIGQLSNINSKLSLWIAGFQPLQPTINQWRVLKRYDATTLRYALQQGFEFNGNIVNNKAEFNSLFETFCASYSYGSINEANYWLVNYVHSSLYEIVIDHLKLEQYSENDFYMLFFMAVKFAKDKGTSIYEVVETLLPELKTKTLNNGLLFDDILKSLHVNIESFWVNDIETKSLRFLDCLLDYLSFTEKNIRTIPDFFGQLTFLLNGSITIGIRQDIEKIKGDENLIKSYSTDLNTFVERLKKINAEMPYIGEYNNKVNLIRNCTQEISRKNRIEKQAKVKILDDKYLDIISNKKKDVSAKFQFSWDDSTYDYVMYITMIVGAILVIMWYIKGVNSHLKGGDRIFELIVGVPIIGAISGTICLGIGWLIKTALNESAKSNDRQIKLNDNLSKVNLSSQEQTVLNDSKKSIDKFFADKESNEIILETVRIFTHVEPDKLHGSVNPNSFNPNKEKIHGNEKLVATDLKINRAFKIDRRDNGIIITDQISFDSGYNSLGSLPFEGHREIKLENSYIFLITENVLEIESLIPIFEKIEQSGKSLLIISMGMGKKVLNTLLEYKKKRNFNFAAVSSPGFGDHRIEILKDIAVMTGGRAISFDNAKLLYPFLSIFHVGKAEKIIVEPGNTTLFKCKGNRARIIERVSLIKKQITDESSEYIKEKLKERLASFTKNNS